MDYGSELLTALSKATAKTPAEHQTMVDAQALLRDLPRVQKGLTWLDNVKPDERTGDKYEKGFAWLDDRLTRMFGAIMELEDMSP